MTDSNTLYSVNDWVIHRFYGIGQIKKIESRQLDGEKKACYKVEILDGFYWFPAEHSENPRIRPVSSRKTLQSAIEELQKGTEEFDPDRKLWKTRIDEVKSDGGLIETSRLVRDLTGLRTQRKLNQTEETALSHLTDLLIREWSACTGNDIASTRPKFEKYLRAARAEA